MLYVQNNLKYKHIDHNASFFTDMSMVLSFHLVLHLQKINAYLCTEIKYLNHGNKDIHQTYYQRTQSA